MSYCGVIAAVVPDSIAAEMGICPGDRLLTVNGQQLRDIIDLSFALADDYIELLIEKSDGRQEVIEIEKDYDEDLGLEFESAVFDGIRRCANHCIFCFVDQMAPDMRPSLYVKDDDYRMSFLYGNFVTLTNLTDEDFARIVRLHLSPLYVSVHTTNGALRANMLHNQKAADIMTQLNRLIEAGIELHTQIVLCPGINDNDVLQQTITDLYALHPGVQSMAIVPVGLSRYRQGCYPLKSFTAAEAYHIINMVSAWQARCRQEAQTSFVYLSDEFYIGADHAIPAEEIYDGFPQLENGIGLVRNFLMEWQQFQGDSRQYQTPVYLDVVCGVSAHKILSPLLEELADDNLFIRLVPVNNTFFGSAITVSGLLTAQDIIGSLKALEGQRSGIIVPGIALRTGEDVFLDGHTWQDIERALDTPVRVAYGGAGLRALLTGWE